MGVSVYTDHLIEGLKLSRVQISTAYMIGTLGSSIIMTRAGIFYDRFGARVAAAGSALGLGLCLMLLSASVEITAGISRITGIPGIPAAFGFMILGFFGIRFFGQGVLTLVSRGMVMRWFESHRGFAAAIMGIFTTFGFSYAPRLLQALIDLSGWKGSWFYTGIALIVLIVPFIIIVFRDSPEDCGIEMEEGVRIRTGSNASKSTAAESKTLQEARKDPALWCYMALLFFWALYNTAFTFHVTSIFDSLGRSTAQAVAIFFPISVLSVGARFLGSWLSDIIDLKYQFFLMSISIAVAGYALTLPYNGVTATLLIAGLGLGGGIFGVLNSVTWPKLYGREHLGAISGMAMSFIVAGSALGPWSFSMLEKIWGHYRHTGWMGVIASSLIGVAGLFILNRKPAEAE